MKRQTWPEAMAAERTSLERERIRAEFMYWRSVVQKEQGISTPETEVAAAILTAVSMWPK